MVARFADSPIVRAARRAWREYPLIFILWWAACLRLAVIATQPLWYDETFTAILTQLPMDRMLAAAAGDVHPPTWYLIERAFVEWFGFSPLALRLPSFILGMLAVWLTWKLFPSPAWRGRVRVGATLLVAFSPSLIYYSNEARMYSLMLVAVLLAALGAMEYNPLLLAFGVCLTLFSHNLGVIYIPTLGLIVLARTRSLFKAAVPMVAGVATWSALWLPNVVQQAAAMGDMGSGYWISKIAQNYFVHLLTCIRAITFPNFTPSFLQVVAPLVVFAMLIWPVVEAFRRRVTPMLLLAGLVYGPLVTMLAISYRWKPILLGRALIGILPAWAGLIAWWVTLPRKWDLPRIVLIGLAAATMLSSSVAYYFHDRTFGVQSAIEFIQANAAPSDLVCHADLTTWVPFDIYYKGPMRIAETTHDLSQTLSEQTVQAIGVPSGPLDRDCRWLVFSRDPLSSDDVIAQAERAIQERNGELVFSSGTLINQLHIWKLRGDTNFIPPIDAQ